MRRKISNTSSAWETATSEGKNMDSFFVAEQLSSFQLQTKHNRAESELVSIGELLQPILDNEPCTLEVLRHRVTSA
eukprot:2621793-Amphidinium_carterae.1